MADKFEVCKDHAGKFRFRLKASNGQVVATGEAYETKAAAKKDESVVRAATGAPIEEVESYPAGRPPRSTGDRRRRASGATSEVRCGSSTTGVALVGVELRDPVHEVLDR